MSQKEAWEKAYKDTPERENAGYSVTRRHDKPLYGPDDVAGVDHERDAAYPGQFPYTRGIHATMYRSKLWTIRQFAGFGSPEESNQRFKYLLEHGQTGLSIAFDLPTLMGLDTDHPLARGEVGRCGVAVASARDMEEIFRDIPMEAVSTSMTINGPAVVLLAFYQVAAERQGADVSRLRGTTQNDILKEFHAQNEWLFPPAPSVRLVVDTIEYCARNMPLWNPVSISGYHIREAGASAEQELAFTLADGLFYVEKCIERGLDVDTAARRLSFFFDAHMDLFEEVAKFRAARRVWARQMRSRFGAADPRSCMLRFHTQTAGVSLTAQQPENNVIRTTIEALAAILGGTQSLHTNSRDETYSLPAEEAVKIALRTQQIIAYETGIPAVIDPLGGAYYVEALTGQFERACQRMFDEIANLGGMFRAIEAGYFRRQIALAAFQQQRELEQQKRLVVGVNCLVEPEQQQIPIFRVDPTVEASQRQRIQLLKLQRDGARVGKALETVRQACRGAGNVMPAVVEAARADCTLGEIAQAMKDVFGDYRNLFAV